MVQILGHATIPLFLTGKGCYGMPYRLRDRLTQEEWFERQLNGEMTDAEIEYARRANSHLLGWDDFQFLYSIKALDWSWAGMMSFQAFIDKHGTEEEKTRLENLRLGYRRSPAIQTGFTAEDNVFLKACGIESVDAALPDTRGR
jgi:hypothetical protein